MIVILNSALKPLAVLDNYYADEITEQINGAYTLKFSIYLDDDKSQYITVGNYAEVEGQLFNIVHHRRTRSDNGEVSIAVECEHVSYDLLYTVFESGFIHSGSPTILLNRALQGTGFTVGTVQPSGIVSVELKEGVNARGVIMEIAAQSGGELRFDKYSISILNRRGQDRGVQFRLGKNLKGIVKDVNTQSGEVVTAYEVNVLDLNTLPEFEGLEHFELGDTVDVIDEELGINEAQRIIQYSYSPRRRINSKVVISSAIEGIQDTLYRIQTTTVGKDKWMYGVKIGPEEGIVQERYDKRARAVWNADEFRMQKGNGSGSYTDSLYFDPVKGVYKFNGELQAASGTFSGDLSAVGGTFTGTLVGVNGTFSGTVSAATVIGSQISGGTISGATITGSVLRTAESGSRIVADASGLRSYDSSNYERVSLGYNTIAGMGGFVFRGPDGNYEGQLYSVQNALHLIAQNQLFLRGFGNILIQGDTQFDNRVTLKGVVDFSQATVIGL